MAKLTYGEVSAPEPEWYGMDGGFYKLRQSTACLRNR